MGNFFSNFVEDLKDEDTTIAADGQSAGEYSGTVPTGSYMLNALLSGSLYGGIPNNKISRDRSGLKSQCQGQSTLLFFRLKHHFFSPPCP